MDDRSEAFHIFLSCVVDFLLREYVESGLVGELFVVVEGVVGVVDSLIDSLSVSHLSALRVLAVYDDFYWLVAYIFESILNRVLVELS